MRGRGCALPPPARVVSAPLKVTEGSPLAGSEGGTL